MNKIIESFNLVIGNRRTIINNNLECFVDKIIINGCNLVKEESIEKQFSYLINKNIYSLNLDDIKTKILEDEFISSVNLIKIYPRTIVLDIVEISPIGIFKSNNTYFLIDNNNNGRLIFELFNDIVPRTCKNFIELCKNKAYTPHSTNPPLFKVESMTVGMWRMPIRT